ncbi:MAG: glycosyltransferase family 2 protein [Chloroflexi bacterium]|nr:MAG: glycosyltransferase family 2 protein [Chloroflexota bacterium]
MDVAVVIPALNEAGNIGALVAQTLAQPVSAVIVADNGSTDDTARLARQAGAQVVHEPRRGYGFACAAGAAAANADVLVFLDGDFSCRPAELPALLAPLRQNRADLVLGSRVLGQIAPGAMPPHQRFGNWLTARLMNRLYGLTVTDLGPYRAIRRPLLQSLGMREMTFGWPTEMTVKSARRRARIVEVPVSWLPRRAGRSKISGTAKGTVLAAYYILGVTLRYAF